MPSDAEVARVLVVAAHPDDLDFGAAGAIAGWCAAGVEVASCVLTDGDAGGFDAAVPHERMPAIRSAEQRAAAAEVGVSDVRFLGFPDGRLVCQSPARTFDRIYASHPDHLAVAALRRHESQAPGVADLPASLTDWLVGNARAAGLPADRLAEAFYVASTA